MARGTRTIRQMIRLEGAREVLAQFVSIATAARAAMASVASNVQPATAAVNGLTTAAQGTVSQLGQIANNIGPAFRAGQADLRRLREDMQFAAAATAVLGAALPVTGAAIVLFANYSVNKFNEVRRAAQDLSITPNIYNDLDTLARKSGETAEIFVKSFDAIKKTLETFSGKSENDAVKSLSGIRNAMIGIGNDLLVVSNKAGLSTRQITNGIKGIDEAINIPGLKNPLEEFRRGLRLTGDGAEAMRKAIEGNLKAFERLPESVQGMLKLGVQLFDSAGKLTKDFGAAIEETIPKLAKVENSTLRAALASQIFGKEVGVELSKMMEKGALTTEEFNRALSLVKLNKNITDGAIGEIEKLIGSIRDANGKLLATPEVYDKVVQALANMEAGFQRSRIAAALFSGTSEELLRSIDRGFTGLRGMAQNVEAVGKQIRKLLDNDPGNLRIAEAWRKEFDDLLQYTKSFGNAFGLSLAEVFTPTLQRLREELDQNFGYYVTLSDRFAKYLAGFANDIINSFTFITDGSGKVQFINQDRVSEARQYLNDIRDGFILFGQSVAAVFNEIIAPTFNAIVTVLDFVAGGFRAFGVDVNGTMIVVALIVAKVTGAIRILSVIVAGALRLLGPIGVLAGIAILAVNKFLEIGGGQKLLEALEKIGLWFGDSLPLAIGIAVLAFSGFVKNVIAGITRIAFAQLSLVPIVGILVAGGFLLALFWDDVVKVSKTAWQKVVDLWGAFWSSVGSTAGEYWNEVYQWAKKAYDSAWAAWSRFWTDLTQPLIDYWNSVTQAAEQARSDAKGKWLGFWSDVNKGVNEYWAAVVEKSKEAADQAGNIWQKMWSGIKSLLGELIGVKPAAAEPGKEGSAPANIAGPFEDAAVRIKYIVGVEIPDAVKAGMAVAQDSFTQMAGVAIGLFQGMKDSFVDRIAEMIAAVNELAKAIAEIKPPSTGGSGGNGGGGQGFASGGYVRGRGTATSDSIPAWLSDGEFVIRAAAVRRYGAGFLAALNGMRLSPRIKQGAPAFAAGGLVSGFQRMEDFAGSSGGAGNPFTLVIGGEAFSGLTAPADAVQRLQRVATAQHARSAGRKPSWYGRR